MSLCGCRIFIFLYAMPIHTLVVIIGAICTLGALFPMVLVWAFFRQCFRMAIRFLLWTVAARSLARLFRRAFVSRCGPWIQSVSRWLRFARISFSGSFAPMIDFVNICARCVWALFTCAVRLCLRAVRCTLCVIDNLHLGFCYTIDAAKNVALYLVVSIPIKYALCPFARDMCLHFFLPALMLATIFWTLNMVTSTLKPTWRRIRHFIWLASSQTLLLWNDVSEAESPSMWFFVRAAISFLSILVQVLFRFLLRAIVAIMRNFAINHRMCNWLTDCEYSLANATFIIIPPHRHVDDFGFVSAIRGTIRLVWPTANPTASELERLLSNTPTKTSPARFFFSNQFGFVAKGRDAVKVSTLFRTVQAAMRCCRKQHDATGRRLGYFFVIEGNN